MKLRSSVITAAALAATIAAGPAMAKPVLLKVPTAYPTGLPGLGTTLTNFAEVVGNMSEGDNKINVKVYAPGKLVAPGEILDAVSSGKVNGGFSSAGFWAGKLKAAPLFSSVPFGPEAGEYLAWMMYGNGSKLYQEMYDANGFNVKAFACGLLAPETSGWFAKEINSPDDLKGLKLRYFGLGAKVMTKLGVSTTQLPGGEVFPALEKNVIDGAEFSMPAIDKLLGFHKVVKYNYFPGWHQQATFLELIINKDAWNSMTPAQQAIIDNGCKAAIAQGFAEGEAIQYDAMLENEEKNGVKIRSWSPEMLAIFREKWEEVVAEETQDPFFKKVYDDLTAFRAKYDVWEKRAFLPRN